MLKSIIDVDAKSNGNKELFLKYIEELKEYIVKNGYILTNYWGNLE